MVAISYAILISHFQTITAEVNVEIIYDVQLLFK